MDTLNMGDDPYAMAKIQATQLRLAIESQNMVATEHAKDMLIQALGGSPYVRPHVKDAYLLSLIVSHGLIHP
jgi:hypothetical protein